MAKKYSAIRQGDYKFCYLILSRNFLILTSGATFFGSTKGCRKLAYNTNNIKIIKTINVKN